ncbi:amidohydrolase family protein [Limibacter armeniacum]|uniref:amidohydrolase family protein n=1 Tax=Limibacter armeniacum TaxID=466084 RepID=UPI002FE63C63
MNKIIKYILPLFVTCWAGSAMAQVPTPAPKQDTPILVKGATVHTGAGTVIENGAVAFEDGKITYVGSADGFTMTGSFKEVDAAGQHVYPGLILPTTDLGLVEIGQVSASKDEREEGSINPEVRALVAYNTDSHLPPTIRSNGILMAQIAPQGGLFSGTSSIVQLDAWNWEDAAYSVDEGIHLNWPSRYLSPRWWMGETDVRVNKKYNELTEEVEKTLRDAAAYAQASSPEEVNIKLEALRGLFDGSKTLYMHADIAKSILQGLQLAEELNVKRVVLVGGAQAWYLKDYLKENNIPVILSNIHRLPSVNDEDVDLPYRLAAMLQQEGVLVGLGYREEAMKTRNLPFFAGTAAAYGMDKEEALKMITSNTAKILGVADKTGSLEVGKDATLIISQGDLLDMRTSNVTQAFIQGRDIDLNNKHKMLYQKFKGKYESTEKVN